MVMGMLPEFDSRPTNPLYGPLSVYLLGENPFEPEERPETEADLAEKLGITAKRLYQIKVSRGFRRFHNEHTSSLDEIVSRRQALLDRLYGDAMAGSASAAALYLKETRDAQTLAAAGRTIPDGMSPEAAAELTDEELEQLLGKQQP